MVRVLGLWLATRWLPCKVFGTFAAALRTSYEVTHHILRIWSHNNMLIELNKRDQRADMKDILFLVPLFTEANKCSICVIIHSMNTDWLFRLDCQSKNNIRK